MNDTQSDMPVDPVAEYQNHLEDMILDFRRLALTNQGPDLTEMVKLLRPDEDNRKMRDYAIEAKIGTKSEFDREIRRLKMREEIGTAPQSAVELVEAWVKTYAVKARMDGLMTRTVKAEFNEGGVKQIITQEDRARCGEVDVYAAFFFDAQNRLNKIDMERELRIMSANYRMGFGERDIADAVDEWLKASRRERLFEIWKDVDRDVILTDTDSIWKDFATKVFDVSETSPEFAAAVIRKFIWQVKRKIRNIPVTDHLMPVLLGPQRIGKSTLVNKILAPVEELKLNIDFSMVTDERNVEIWSSYVMFLDEMGYASKADIDTVKNIITATTLTRRPMRSNGRVTIDQNATLIGCSNRELSQLIRDPTGNRRFVGLRMRSDADRAFINGLDWRTMWSSVDETAADPMTPFQSVLSEQQEGARERSRVEQWMVDFDGHNTAYQSRIDKGGFIASNDLYLAYREYEDDFYAGTYKMSKTDWDYEMTRLRKNTPDVVVFDRKRGGAGMMYRWHGEDRKRAVDNSILRIVD